MIQQLIRAAAFVILPFALLFFSACSSSPNKQTTPSAPPKKDLRTRALPPKSPPQRQTQPNQTESNQALYSKFLQSTSAEELSSSDWIAVSQKAKGGLSEEQQNQIIDKGVVLIQNSNSLSLLQSISESEVHPRWLEQSLFRRAQILLSQDQSADAEDLLQNIEALKSGSVVEAQAKEMRAEIQSLRRVSRSTVGVILPFTPRHASLSTRTLRGLKMGLGLYKEKPSPFQLAVADSEAQPEAARRAVEKLVKEDNVIAIVGSFLSKTSMAIAAAAQEYNVPYIELSQKMDVTTTGDFVFRNSITSEMQTQRLVQFAMNDLGMKNFAIVYPNEPFGIEYANLFWDQVLARGGQITAVQSYSPKETSFESLARRLTGLSYIDGRKEELRIRSKDKAKDKKEKPSNSRSEATEEILPPIVQFDAVFIPDSPKVAGQIVAMLAYVGVRNVSYLGPQIWNQPDLARRMGASADRTYFVDTISELIPETVNSNFYSEYVATFGERPGLFDFQAFDTAVLLREILAKGVDTRTELREELETARVQSPISGTLLMTQDREVDRPLFIYKVESGATQVIK